MKPPDSRAATLLALALGLFAGCGEREQDSLPPAPPPPPEAAAENAEETSAAPPAADPAVQQQLFDEAIAIARQVGDCLSSISDRASIAAASERITELDAELESIAQKLAASEPPTTELLAKFREQASQSDRQMMAETQSATQAIQADPDAIRQLNRALDSLAKTRQHPAFKAFGIGGE